MQIPLKTATSCYLYFLLPQIGLGLFVTYFWPMRNKVSEEIFFFHDEKEYSLHVISLLSWDTFMILGAVAAILQA